MEVDEPLDDELEASDVEHYEIESVASDVSFYEPESESENEEDELLDFIAPKIVPSKMKAYANSWQQEETPVIDKFSYSADSFNNATDVHEAYMQILSPGIINMFVFILFFAQIWFWLIFPTGIYTPFIFFSIVKETNESIRVERNRLSKEGATAYYLKYYTDTDETEIYGLIGLWLMLGSHNYSNSSVDEIFSLEGDASSLGRYRRTKYEKA